MLHRRYVYGLSATYRLRLQILPGSINNKWRLGEGVINLAFHNSLSSSSVARSNTSRRSSSISSWVGPITSHFPLWNTWFTPPSLDRSPSLGGNTLGSSWSFGHHLSW